MAGNSITINTEQVEQIANSIEELNTRLREELNNCKATIDNLENVWEGDASRETISSFDEFATKYLLFCS